MRQTPPGGGLTPDHGYCKIKKDGKEPHYEDDHATASCESNSDCRDWDNAGCPRYCEKNTKRCLKWCMMKPEQEYMIVTCDIGSGSTQCGTQFKYLKQLKHDKYPNLNENGLDTFLDNNPSRLVCLNNKHRYDDWEEMGDFGSPAEYYINKWIRFRVGACHVSCSSDNDCKAFADILFGADQGSHFRTCRFDSDGVGAAKWMQSAKDRFF